MTNIFEIAERHIKSLFSSHRSTVFFYDKKRDELFRRIKTNEADKIESNFI